jgi:hypothetical protein
LCRSQKKCYGGCGNDQTSVRGRKHEPYKESLNSRRPKKARQAKSKFQKSMLIIFFGIKGIIHKTFALACQTVNSAYYCDVLRSLRENLRRLRPELWRQKNWLLNNDNSPSHISFFTREFQPTTTYCRPPPTLLFSVSQIEHKTERPPFYHN